MNSHAQVVIIGGGIAGCSLLYHLSQLGWSDVVLIEEADLSAGTAWYGAGHCSRFAYSPTLMALRAASVRLYNDLDNVDFHACGTLRITANADRLDEFRYVQDIGRIAGHQFDLLTPNDIRALYPLMQTEGLIGGLHQADDGYVCPEQVIRELVTRARDMGASVHERTPVTGIDQNEDGSWRIKTGTGAIEADAIVNSAGPRTHEVGRMMGIEVPSVPLLHQYLITESISGPTGQGGASPVVVDPDQGWYARQNDGGMVFGSCARPPVPWGSHQAGAPYVTEDACQRIPVLATTPIKAVISGPASYSPDGHPLIGPVYGMQDAWLLTDAGADVMEAGGAGELLAEWITSRTPPRNVLDLDPRRFGAFAETQEFREAKAIESATHQFAIHFPDQGASVDLPCLKLPSRDRQAELGAQFGFAYGWDRANWFANDAVQAGQAGQAPGWRRSNWFDAVRDECRAVQEAAGLFDLTAFTKFDVIGDEASEFLDSLGSNKPPRSDGGMCLTYALTPEGGIESEFTVTRLAQDRFYLVSAAGARRRDHDLLMSALPRSGCTVTDVTEDLGVLALAGPQSRNLLSSITSADLSNDAFPWLSGQEIRVAGVPVRAIRVSYVGEMGWEIHHQIGDQAMLYDAFLEAGEPYGLRPCGEFAMNSLRIEKGHRGWGVDLTSEKTPLEAGLHPFVKLEGRGFIGKDAVLTRSQANPGSRMMLLSLEAADTDVFGMHPVLMDGDVVGVTSSGGYGHRVGQSLALAYLRTDVPMDAKLSVSVLAKPVTAEILERVPYDPTNVRMRA